MAPPTPERDWKYMKKVKEDLWTGPKNVDS